MGQKALFAGFYATVIGLIFGAAVGGLGAWGAMAAAAKTQVGGWLVLLAIGSALGYLYSLIKVDKFFGKEVIAKGAAYGAAVWILSLILAAAFPGLSAATYADPIRATLFLQLATHLVWGVSLGIIYENL